MNSKSVMAACLAGLCCAAGAWGQAVNAPTHAQDNTSAEHASREVARVNDEGVSAALFELVLHERLRMGAQDNAALREAVRRDLVLQALLAQQATQQQLDKHDMVQLRLASARKAVLASAWQQQWLHNHPVSDDELQAEYQEWTRRWGSKQYQIRQVVLQDETSARMVLEQLKAGKHLEELARTYSTELQSKAEGGLLPWAHAGMLIAPLGEVLAKAQVGQTWPEPVRTAAGWHVLALVAERPFVPPSIDVLKPQLQQSRAQRKLEAAIQAQITRARIEWR